MDYYELFYEYLKERKPLLSEKDIVLWGAGKYGKIAYAVLWELGLACRCFIDSNANGFPNGMLGKEVLPPHSVKDGNPYVIVATAQDQEIEAELLKAGKGTDSYLLLWSGIRNREPVNQFLSHYRDTPVPPATGLDHSVPFMGKRYVNDGIFVAQIDGFQAQTRARTAKKLASPETRTETVNCLCGGNNFLTLSEKDRFGLPLKTAMCMDCGIILQNPRLTQEEFNAFYASDFLGLTTNHYAVSTEDYFFWRKHDGPYVIHEAIKDVLSCDKHILEIGCGAGGMLDYFRELGYRVTGIDLSGESVAYGKSRGLDLHCSNASDWARNESNRYDIIILAHVLEHFLDIERELAVVKSLLKPGGYLYVGLPGIKGFALASHRFDFLNSLQLPHTYYFDQDTFTQMMTWYGFRCVHCNEYISGLFQVDGSVPKTMTNYSGDLLQFLTHLEAHYKDLQKGIYHMTE